MTKERTRDDWSMHLYNIMDIANACRSWKNCEQCINACGPCRRNMAILELRYVIHKYFDLLEEKETTND